MAQQFTEAKPFLRMQLQSLSEIFSGMMSFGLNGILCSHVSIYWKNALLRGWWLCTGLRRYFKQKQLCHFNTFMFAFLMDFSPNNTNYSCLYSSLSSAAIENISLGGKYGNKETHIIVWQRYGIWLYMACIPSAICILWSWTLLLGTCILLFECDVWYDFTPKLYGQWTLLCKCCWCREYHMQLCQGVTNLSVSIYIFRAGLSSLVRIRYQWY